MPLFSDAIDSVRPLGVLGYAQVTANQGPTAGPWAITGGTITVNVAAGRRIRVSFAGLLASSVTTDSIQISLYEASTLLTQAIPQVGAVAVTTSGSVILTPSIGAHTYFLEAVRASGTGNLTNYAAANLPTFILAEDIGT